MYVCMCVCVCMHVYILYVHVQVSVQERPISCQKGPNGIGCFQPLLYVKVTGRLIKHVTASSRGGGSEGRESEGREEESVD